MTRARYLPTRTYSNIESNTVYFYIFYKLYYSITWRHRKSPLLGTISKNLHILQSLFFPLHISISKLDYFFCRYTLISESRALKLRGFSLFTRDSRGYSYSFILSDFSSYVSQVMTCIYRYPPRCSTAERSGSASFDFAISPTKTRCEIMARSNQSVC